MKGMSMTLTIVVVAIVLLVTALVIMTVFGAQMAQVMGVLNPWSSSMLQSSLCQQKCATACQLNPDKPTIPWSGIYIPIQDPDNQESEKEVDCKEIMRMAQGLKEGTTPTDCQCLGIRS